MVARCATEHRKLHEPTACRREHPGNWASNRGVARVQELSLSSPHPQLSASAPTSSPILISSVFNPIALPPSFFGSIQLDRQVLRDRKSTVKAPGRLGHRLQRSWPMPQSQSNHTRAKVFQWLTHHPLHLTTSRVNHGCSAIGPEYLRVASCSCPSSR